MAKRVYPADNLSGFLRARRDALGLSTIDVETLTQNEPKEFKLSRGFVWQIEHGSKPSPYKLLSLAKVYGLTIWEIYKAIAPESTNLCPHVSTKAAKSNVVEFRRIEPPRTEAHELLHSKLQTILDANGDLELGITVNINAIHQAIAIKSKRASPSAKRRGRD